MQHPLLRVIHDLGNDAAFVVAEILIPAFGYAFGDVLSRVGVSTDPESFIEKLR